MNAKAVGRPNRETSAVLVEGKSEELASLGRMIEGLANKLIRGSIVRIVIFVVIAGSRVAAYVG